MSHTFTPDFGTGYLYSALITNNTLITDFFIFPAEALEVFGRPEDTFTKVRLFRVLEYGS